jgi:hypothetical protein
MNIHDRIAYLEASIDEDQHASLRELDELRADRNEAVYSFALILTDVLADFMGSSSEHLTCYEFDAIIDLYESMGLDATGLIKGSSHVEKDKQGDTHWQGAEDMEWPDPSVHAGGPQ